MTSERGHLAREDQRHAGEDTRGPELAERRRDRIRFMGIISVLALMMLLSFGFAAIVGR